MTRINIWHGAGEDLRKRVCLGFDAVDAGSPQNVVGALGALIAETAVVAVGAPPPSGWISCPDAERVLYGRFGEGATVWGYIRAAVQEAYEIPDAEMPDIGADVARMNAAMGTRPFPPYSCDPADHPTIWALNAGPLFRVAMDEIMNRRGVESAERPYVVATALLKEIGRRRAELDPATALSIAVESMLAAARLAPIQSPLSEAAMDALFADVEIQIVDASSRAAPVDDSAKARGFGRRKA